MFTCQSSLLHSHFVDSLVVLWCWISFSIWVHVKHVAS